MFYFLERSFWNYPGLVITLIISLVTVIFLRYFIASVIYKILLERFFHTKRNSFKERSSQIKREIRWAMLSSLIFALLCAISLLAYQYELTAIYVDVETYPWTYFFASPVIVVLLYETYYYWLHRWMHQPRVFKIIHKVHHDSILPTVFTAFSFHPLEALLQFIFFPVLIIFIPLHPIMIGVIFTALTISAMVNHSGAEVYGTRSLQKHIIGSTHHDLHHRMFKFNFGLTLTWWDKWMKTEYK
ncbi:MAG TPA: sterol desaturase family protein [Chryseolinea sp.]